MGEKVEKTVIKENKMGTMPVGRLLISMSVPMMCSMLVQALYNIVDSIFVARIEEDALTAVSMAFPLQTLMFAIGVGLGVGVNAMLSKSLGEKDFDSVNKAATNGIFMSAVNYIIFLIIGLNLVEPFYRSQTDNENIIRYGVTYLTLCCCLSFGVYTQLIFERLLQSTGKTFYNMITQGTGAIINIIMDPILIFGLFGVPRLGIAGAAIATVAGQIVAATMAVIFNLKVNKEITLSFKGFKPDIKVIGRIYKVGLPSIIMQSIGSIMVYGMNRILNTFSSTAVAVFGVYFKLQSFVFMPIFGLNNGMVPIVAYNFGAENRIRMKKTIRFAIYMALAIMLFGLLIFEILPGQLFTLFNASEHMLSMGKPALRIIAIHFPIAAYCIVVGTVFQSLGNGVYSMFVSILRQIVVLLPAAYLLALTGNVNNVWWSFPIAEVMSATATTIFYIKINKDIISKVPDGTP
ncbi:MAG: MATE family efflux transporter [Lachnospiraceae bacterium]|nr:MATE family efflux transporter [Lachnospiraceae bacterium]